MNDHVEMEVKFHLNAVDPVREAIRDAGAVSLGRVFEVNIRFDDNTHTLFRKKALLRLRKDQKNRLTFKSPPPAPDPDVKAMREIEVLVDDFDAAQNVLNALGFFEVQRYEKWRETFSFENALLLIDAMPFGDFLEIEGEKPAIRAIASGIGLRWEHRILHNYLEIFEAVKSRMNLGFNDVTFENFKNNPVDIADFIDSFYASGRKSH